VNPQAKACRYGPVGNRQSAVGWDAAAGAPETLTRTTHTTCTANSLNQYK
jgi:hypothetical protein